ncbi:MAG TPA: radical SAM family heme chaperone HemW [Vicinamibacteria bacterium]|nr:radical SAM family heme chaperone HemW [Vicinamibacteria bacterium]
MIGLYVHIPFCEVKCTYCHFAISPGPAIEDRQERYLLALLAEIEGTPPAAADTLYFGGGTPSLLTLPRLTRLLHKMRERFSLDPPAEITLEANPKDLDLEGYRALRQAGVNRLSLGVQSFDDAVLAEMGRRHSAADSQAAAADARQAGFANLSLDLILGWPGETPERWRQTIDVALALAPAHVSLYLLEAEGKTVLGHRQRQGRLALPADDLLADLYRQTVDRLGRAGLSRYEIANFARPGFESRHNGKYWDDAPVLGFGMAAHGYADGVRYWNREGFGGYCRAVETAGAAAARAGERRLTPEERVGEALFTGLRRAAGIDLVRFRERYGVDPLDSYRVQLGDVFRAELVEVREGALRLTPRGVLLSNEVFRAFV